MFYVGIDIAKNTHEVAILSESGELLGTTMKVANTIPGAEKLLKHLVTLGVTVDNAVVGMELPAITGWQSIRIWLGESTRSKSLTQS